jgi:hypothetical protein
MPEPSLYCSFCGESQHEVSKLIAGPGAFICAACVELAGGAASSGQPAATRLGQLRAVPEQDAEAPCSFCGKPRARVAALAGLSPELPADPPGPPAICTECLELCDEILDEELGPIAGS